MGGIIAACTTNVTAFTRKRPSRQPFLEHLPRERVVEPAPVSRLCCGGVRLRRLGEDVIETLKPAPFRAMPRGWAGPSLLVMIVFEKFGQHQPLNRQLGATPVKACP